MPDDARDFHRLVQSGYDAVANAYVHQFRDELDAKPFDRGFLQRFQDRVGPNAVVADIGCGPGQIGGYLAGLGPRVLGFDLSHGMMSAGRAGIAGDRLTFVQADMTRLPIRDAMLDGLMAFYSIIHLRREDVPRALSELRRVVKPGATLAISVHAGEAAIGTDNMLDQGVRMVATLFTKAEIEGLLRDAGFDVLEITEREPYPEESGTRRVYAMGRA